MVTPMKNGFDNQGCWTQALGEFQSGVMLREKGVLTLLSYYIRKYNFELKDPKDYLVLDYETQNFKSKFEHNFSQLDINAKEKRLGFIYKRYGHSTPFFYLHVGNLRMFYICDALGINLPASNTKDVIEYIVNSNLKYPIYCIIDPRQRDSYSCHTDAVYMLKQVLRKNSYDSYEECDLIPFLKESSCQVDIDGIKADLFATGLPISLLRTAQHGKFFQKHFEKSKYYSHYCPKWEILKKEVISQDDDQKRAFLRLKGLRYQKVIMIQLAYHKLQTDYGENIQSEIYQNRTKLFSQFLAQSRQLKKKEELSVHRFSNKLSELLNSFLSQKEGEAQNNQDESDVGLEKTLRTLLF